MAGIAAGALLVAGCGGAQSALDPHGTGARDIARIWWFMLALSSVIFVIVLALLAVALWHGHRERSAGGPGPHEGLAFVVIGGGLVPLLVLAVLVVVMATGLRGLSASTADPALRIEVVAHDWWWEIRYPDRGAITANIMHLPAGQDVEIVGTSDDVIHSLWAPPLGGKIDLIPGRTNTVVWHVDSPGTVRGQCAEFCGVQHARMAFEVVAQPPAEFNAWLAEQAQGAAEPSDDLARRGRDVFFSSSCVSCHAIRGTAADRNEGPDLTHLAARPSLAALTIPNDRSHLATWITAPQTVKPGGNMPPTSLSSDDLAALLAYLGGLK